MHRCFGAEWEGSHGNRETAGQEPTWMTSKRTWGVGCDLPLRRNLITAQQDRWAHQWWLCLSPGKTLASLLAGEDGAGFGTCSGIYIWVSPAHILHGLPHSSQAPEDHRALRTTARESIRVSLGRGTT